MSGLEILETLKQTEIIFSLSGWQQLKSIKSNQVTILALSKTHE